MRTRRWLGRHRADLGSQLIACRAISSRLSGEALEDGLTDFRRGLHAAPDSSSLKGSSPGMLQ
jgi:hypothetical protein